MFAIRAALINNALVFILSLKMYIVIYNRMIRQQRSEKLTDVNNSSTLLKTLKVQGAKKTKRNETKGVAEL